MTNCWRKGVGNEPSTSSVPGSHHQAALPVVAPADDRLAIQQRGRASRARETKPPRLSGSVARGGGRRAGTENDRAAPEGGSSTTHQDLGGVRLYTVTAGFGGPDARAGQRRLHRACGTHFVYRGMRNRQNASLKRPVCGGLPAETAGSLYHGGGLSQ